MTGPNAFVVVPVKSFQGAKRRLAPMLGVSERAGLVRAMLADVLAAAVAVVGPQRVLVVTGDGDVAADVREIGVGVVDDEGARGTNAAVKIGFAAVARHGGAAMALLGDIPGVVPADIVALFAAAERAQVALAPAPEDGGTNALACREVGRIAPCFGPNSFARHIATANAVGIRPVVLLNQRLGLDIDEPHHLRTFLERATSSQTDRYLRTLNLGARSETSMGVTFPAGIGQRGGAVFREAYG
jgi:2-phospho-L-lactate guanylyltransferase